MHPEADAEDQELRIGNLSWLLVQSIHWIRAIPLTDSPSGRFDASAVELAARAHSTDATGADNHPDAALIEAARADTPFEFYQQLAAGVPQAREALHMLEAVVDAQLGQEGPSFTATRDALDDAGAIALRMAAAAGVVLEGVAATALSNGGSDDMGPATPLRADGEITTRRQALLQLRRVAEFFRRTEPHSPVGYLADRAAHWGNMPLHVWLKAVLKENPALAQLEELLGVGTDEPGSGARSNEGN